MFKDGFWPESDIHKSTSSFLALMPSRICSNDGLVRRLQLFSKMLPHALRAQRLHDGAVFSQYFFNPPSLEPRVVQVGHHLVASGERASKFGFGEPGIETAGVRAV